jgi:hypothetical protein
MDVEIPHEACFEAGIKFGSLYHQFAGTPVSPSSAASLEQAIEEAIGNQPFCESVSVRIRREALRVAVEAGSADYTELTGSLMDVELRVRKEGITARASMAMEEGYPLMRLDAVER